MSAAAAPDWLVEAVRHERELLRILGRAPLLLSTGCLALDPALAALFKDCVTRFVEAAFAACFTVVLDVVDVGLAADVGLAVAEPEFSAGAARRRDSFFAIKFRPLKSIKRLRFFAVCRFLDAKLERYV